LLEHHLGEQEDEQGNDQEVELAPSTLP